MSRYYIAESNQQPTLITNVTIDGMRISNPSDALLDANGIGYSRTIIDPPEVTDTQKLEHNYAIQDGSIIDVWTITDKTAQELIDMYTAQIMEIYQSAEQYKNDGQITYPATGKTYIPRWVYEFYNAVLIGKDSYFPTPESTIDITAVDGTTDAMTFTEFITFYGYLITSYMTTTATQNAEIKVLTDRIKELRG